MNYLNGYLFLTPIEFLILQKYRTLSGKVITKGTDEIANPIHALISKKVNKQIVQSPLMLLLKYGNEELNGELFTDESFSIVYQNGEIENLHFLESFLALKLRIHRKRSIFVHIKNPEENSVEYFEDVGEFSQVTGQLLAFTTHIDIADIINAILYKRSKDYEVWQEKRLI